VVTATAVAVAFVASGRALTFSVVLARLCLGVHQIVVVTSFSSKEITLNDVVSYDFCIYNVYVWPPSDRQGP